MPEIERFRERTKAHPDVSGGSYGQWCQIEYDVLDPSHIIRTFPSPEPVQSFPPFLSREKSWDRKNPGPPFRKGGPFDLLKSNNRLWAPQGIGTYRTAPEELTGPLGSERFGYEYAGGFGEPQWYGDTTTQAQYGLVGYTPGTPSGFVPDISGLGPEAYRRLRPQLEHAGMGQFLGEIRDLPRMLKTSAQSFHQSWEAMNEHAIFFIDGVNRGKKIFNLHRGKKMPKKIGDQFVNEQFGWVPFISDLISFADVYDHSKEYIVRNSERNNTWQHRTRVLSFTEEETILSSGALSGCWPAGDNLNRMMRPGPGGMKAWHETTKSVRTEIWASGRFKYYSPEFDMTLTDYESQWYTVKRYLDVYGARINPSVLYKITPWSWLVDWFSNVGTNIDNATAIAQDGLVSENVFTMAHQTSTITMKSWMNFWDKPVTCEWSRNIESKQRAEGGPYGLGWSSGSLSARQLAILGALGISRGT